MAAKKDTDADLESETPKFTKGVTPDEPLIPEVGAPKGRGSGSAGPAAQLPSLGRIVLYTNRGGPADPYPIVANAAIITRVEPPPPPPEFPPVPDPKAPPIPAPGPVGVNAPVEIPPDPLKVSLTVFRAMGNQHTEHGVEFTTAEPGSPEARGKWSWPPRV